MFSHLRHALLPAFLLCALGCASLSAAGDDSRNPSGFSETQLAFVKGWILERAPECPQDVADVVAAQFLDDLQTNHPAKFDQLLSGGIPSNEFEPTLLRELSAHLPGPSWSALREHLALRRVQLLISSGAIAGGSAQEDAAGVVARIRAGSDLYYRRLIDGKIEDDDLALVVRKYQPGGDPAKGAEAPRPKALTAQDIVLEYARRNVDGSSIQKLHGYVVEGDVDTASVGAMHLVLFKLRPDFVRMVFMKDGVTRSVVAGHAGAYWRQAPGKAPEGVGENSIAEMRNVGEFIDPLFADGGFTYERLPDGGGPSGAYYRIAVTRPSGSNYVARIDPSDFHQIGREEDKGAVSVYSDFRKVAGISVAFRQETTDAKGARSVFKVSRFTPNPGLAQALFDPPPPRDQAYFDIERLVARSSGTAPEAR
jgi:hypothetical protein